MTPRQNVKAAPRWNYSQVLLREHECGENTLLSLQSYPVPPLHPTSPPHHPPPCISSLHQDVINVCECVCSDRPALVLIAAKEEQRAVRAIDEQQLEMAAPLIHHSPCFRRRPTKTQTSNQLFSLTAWGRANSAHLSDAAAVAPAIL